MRKNEIVHSSDNGGILLSLTLSSLHGKGRLQTCSLPSQHFNVRRNAQLIVNRTARSQNSVPELETSLVELLCYSMPGLLLDLPS